MGGTPRTEWGSGLQSYIYEATLFMEASRLAAHSQGLGKKLGFGFGKEDLGICPTNKGGYIRLVECS